MLAKNIFLRISKFLGKAILGLLVVLFTIVVLIHIPPIQKEITRVVSNYLSSKIKTRVDLESIHFSVLGNASIVGLKVWDPDTTNIFSAGKIDVTSSIFDLVSGHLIFDEIRIAGVSGQLVQHKEGLNIQFIIDAFQPPATQAKKSSATKLQLKRIVLEDITFHFSSTVDGTAITCKLGKFTSDDVEIFTNPNKISADQVYLENSTAKVVYTQRPDTIKNLVASENSTLLLPDFGTGIIFEFNNIELKDNDFSFHKDQVATKLKFDPSHIDLKNIQLHLSNILIRTDTLAAALQSLSAQLPGFKLSEGKADIKLNRNLISLSDLHLASNANELNADLIGGYDVKSGKNNDHAHMEIDVHGRIAPGDFVYFFSDSIMKHFSNWQTMELQLQGNYARSNGEIKTLNLKTGNSQIQVKGMIHDVLDAEKLNWNDVVIRSTVGSDFKSTITPLLKSITLPPDVAVRLTSSGTLNKIFLDGNVFSTWGNVKLTGFATQPANNVAIDMNAIGEKVDIGKWMNLSWLGQVDLTVGAKGSLRKARDVEIKGFINFIEIMNEPIHAINLQGRITHDNSTAKLSIEDPNYRSEINSEISFAEPLFIITDVRFNSFNAGALLPRDTTLFISGGLKSKIKINGSTLEGYVESDSILFADQSTKYLLDTLALHAMISPTATNFEYYTDYEKGKLVSNFDIRDSRDLIQTWSENILKASNNIHHIGNRTISLNLELVNANLFQLLGIDVDHFSSLRIIGGLDEQKQTGTLQATTGNFKGYGISLDTLSTDLTSVRDDLSGGITAKNLLFNSTPIGNLDFSVFTKEDTATSILLLSDDSITTLGLRARIFRNDSGVFVYPDKLQAFERDYRVDLKSPVYINKNNIDFENFTMTHDDTQISLDGDLKAFDINLTNVDLTFLNYVLFPDSAVINKGHLTGRVSYSQDKKLDLKADVDSLSLYNSSPLKIVAKAVTDKNKVPFEFLLTNTSNKIDVKGQYFFANKEVDASLVMDVDNLEMFAFLVSGVIDDMDGTIKGEAKISGPIQTPEFKGHLRLVDVGFTTSNPKLNFNVQDDIVTLDNSGLLFKDFTLYDQDRHPLILNGNLTSKDYKSFAYDLKLKTDNFNLINNPDSSHRRLRGLLVVASDIKLTGNEKDTHVEAGITIKNATNLTFVNSSDDIELLKAEGVIDFIDPQLLLDSLSHQQSTYFYDSLIASLPDFNLNSTVNIEDDATIRVIIDEQSGDYAEASGGATLELGYDRTGNVRLSGNYTIKKGVYRLSFYDLVKKNFTLVPGSSINWSGSPENGELDIKAVHTVETNSIGLIGDEVGDNEKSIYKRSLDYEVGINIKGTIEKPVVSFSLDLPKEELVNYPVLANKLDRLRLPEYGSELNKQVFGLLVLGGFLPETSSDINSNVVATTALSNSVNSLLAGQLNRFASQYVKGVNIDVGIQSYSDYSAPGGKTRTAMDFRVSKTIMNERLSFEIGGDFDINQDQSGSNTGSKNYRGDIAIIYDLTAGGDKQLKLFNNETYDIIYQEIRNTGISLIFIREFDKDKKRNNQDK